MMDGQTLRKIRLLFQAAVNVIERSRMGRAALAALRATAVSFARVLRQLWLEVTGFTFLAMAVVGAMAGVREYGRYQSGHATGPGRLLLAVFFTVSFAWFGLSSFWRVKQEERKAESEPRMGQFEFVLKGHGFTLLKNSSFLFSGIAFTAIPSVLSVAGFSRFRGLGAQRGFSQPLQRITAAREACSSDWPITASSEAPVEEGQDTMTELKTAEPANKPAHLPPYNKKLPLTSRSVPSTHPPN